MSLSFANPELVFVCLGMRVYEPVHRPLFQGNGSNWVRFLLLSQRFRDLFATIRAEPCHPGQPGDTVRAKEPGSSLEVFDSDCALGSIYIVNLNS